MSAYELEVRDGQTDATVHVALAGELDLTNAREVEGRLLGTFREGSRFVLDLDRVSFIDSAALHVLFRLARTLGPDMLTVVVAPDAPVARTLQIVGVPEAMTVASSMDAPAGDAA